MKAHLTAFAFVASLIVFVFHPAPARAQLQCGPWVRSPIGPAQQCTAFINSNTLNQEIFDKFQWQNEWCWAASISMIFQYYRHPLPQPEIVQQAYGGIVNLPGTPAAIMGSLNRQWTDTNGVAFSSSAQSIVVPAWRAAQDLAADHPLIIATLGHAMVLTAVTYWHDSAGRGQTIGAIVRDPWPANGVRRPLSPQELANTMMLIEVNVQ